MASWLFLWTRIDHLQSELHMMNLLRISSTVANYKYFTNTSSVCVQFDSLHSLRW